LSVLPLRTVPRPTYRRPLNVAQADVPSAAKRLVMHARELIELAAIVSAHGPVLIRGSQPLSPSGVEQYWTASKCRLDRWGHSLKSFSDASETTDHAGRQAHWPVIRGVLEEILTGEILTRTWTAVLCAYDRQHGSPEAGPIVRSVLVGHLEARHRVLTLLVGGRTIDAEQAVKLNHLRRRCERWSDLLIGYLSGLHEVSEFAADPQRARDFAEDLQYRGNLRGGRHAWPLVLASLRSAFRQRLAVPSPNADLNARIASSILCCFQPELFDSTGIFRSLWLWRLCNVTHDAVGMIEELLALEEPLPQGNMPTSAHSSNRLRRFGK